VDFIQKEFYEYNCDDNKHSKADSETAKEMWYPKESKLLMIMSTTERAQLGIP